MPSNSITEFRQNFKGGTRRNRFEVFGMNFPAQAGGGNIDTFHAYAFNLPQVAIGQIPVDYRGRRVYIPGDRDYAEWTLTILDDNAGNGATIYPAFQDWQNAINGHVTNESSFGGTDAAASAGRQNWTIKHMDYDGSTTLKTINLVGCWPVALGAVALSAGSRDELVTFDVTIRYDYLTYGGGGSGVAGPPAPGQGE